MESSIRQLFIQSLRQGMGLSKSAISCGLAPKEVSAMIESDSTLKTDCLVALRLGLTTYLALVKTVADKKKFQTWANKVEELRGFITQLNLWESLCLRSEVDDDAFMAALIEYRVIDEAATVIGFTRREFIAYLLDRPYLAATFKEYGIFLESPQ